MANWAIDCRDGFQAVEVLSETEKTVKYRYGCKESRAAKAEAVPGSGFQSGGILPWRGSEGDARSIAKKLNSYLAEKKQREIVARETYTAKSHKLLRIIT